MGTSVWELILQRWWVTAKYARKESVYITRREAMGFAKATKSWRLCASAPGCLVTLRYQ